MVNVTSRFKPILALLLMGLLAACTSGYQVQMDYNPEARFLDKKTYAIVLPESMVTVPSPLVAQRVEQAIRNEMSIKGIEEVDDPADADIHVSFITTSEDRQDLRVYESYNNYYGYRACYRCYPMMPMTTTEVYTVDYVEGQLIIDIIDPQTRSLMWRGMTTKKFGRREVVRLLPEEITEMVNEAVAAVLGKYPPL